MEILPSVVDLETLTGHDRKTEGDNLETLNTDKDLRETSLNN